MESNIELLSLQQRLTYLTILSGMQQCLKNETERTVSLLVTRCSVDYPLVSDEMKQCFTAVLHTVHPDIIESVQQQAPLCPSLDSQHIINCLHEISARHYCSFTRPNQWWSEQGDVIMIRSFTSFIQHLTSRVGLEGSSETDCIRVTDVLRKELGFRCRQVESLYPLEGDSSCCIASNYHRRLHEAIRSDLMLPLMTPVRRQHTDEHAFVF